MIHQVLAQKAVSEEVTFKKLFETSKELIDSITSSYPESALKLYLQLILCINEVDATEKAFNEFTYELASSALMIFQDEISDANLKMEIIHIIIGTFTRISCVDPDNYDTLVSNTTQYSSKLLKKQDQLISVLNCTHLFYNGYNKAENRVLECFKRCLKIAETCLKQNARNVYLYIHILNKFFYFWNEMNIDLRDI